ncbi:hypothetical protein [Paenibacillus polymyxa]|uniref:hypothetical protein n=1 Tax=Paenibacillus polymyxa TaxID=1406 RepID=UPI0012B51120|nr:hypothetical protein [Paenibacillus polymyxa]WEK65597.1 hypothetical protein ERJ71_14885 [Paenibacillus polymyxa]
MSKMYHCIGVPKRHLFHLSHYEGCGEKWVFDYDKCPICRGYLIPESLISKQANHSEVIQLKKESIEEESSLPKLLYEIKTYEYENYEEYLQHAVEMTNNGWKFQSQSNNHKEVVWTIDHRN